VALGAMLFRATHPRAPNSEPPYAVSGGRKP
jgi:hypothetical protein